MTIPPELKNINKTTVLLPSGKKVTLPLYYAVFRRWAGKVPRFDFGKKPFVKYNSKATFAELAILKLFTSLGWDGVWVETYGGKNFIRTMPNSWKLAQSSIPIPEDKENLLKRIWKAGKTTACFDVFLWKNGDILFCESKHKGKDKLTKAQTKFIEGALACGIKKKNLLIIEWEYE